LRVKRHDEHPIRGFYHEDPTKILARLHRNQIDKKMFTTKDTKITKFGV
jgi:hypothetical protein